MNRRTFVTVPLLLCLKSKGADAQFTLTLRTRKEVFRGSDEWQPVSFQRTFRSRECALVLCDMWDRHWCRGATQRVSVLARRAAPVIARLRDSGMLIIHAPSETMGFYKDAPQRAQIQSAARLAPPAPKNLPDPALPVDDSDGGCDTDDKFFKAWTRQHPDIPIKPGDLISDSGEEIYSVLKSRGIGNLLVAGVHTNMCVLNRSFAIRQMTKWGIRCILIRDLTDAMYDPKDSPYVSHDRGTEMVVEHIEKYWAPTVTSEELLRALT
jgi:nicotinamidase-related amidase